MRGGSAGLFNLFGGRNENHWAEQIISEFVTKYRG